MRTTARVAAVHLIVWGVLWAATALSPGAAATVSWVAPAGGNWNTGSNWSTGTPPGPTDDAVITLAGTYTVTIDVTVAAVGSLTLGGASGTQALSTNGRTLTLNGASTINPNGVLNLAGGVVNGVGNLAMNGTFNWSFGTMGGTGTTTISAGKTLNLISSTHTLLRPLVNAGTILWAAGALDSGQGTTLTNLAGGVFDCQVNQTLFSNQGGALARFDNAGIFRKSAGVSDTTCNWVFNNTGTVQAQSGSIRLANGGTSTGTFDASTGTLEFANGTHILNAGAACTGAGFCRLTFGTLALGANLNVTNFAITGGTLNGAGNLTVGTVLNWSAGTMSGTGTTIIPAGKMANLSGSTHVLLRPLSNAGSIFWTAGALDSGQGNTLTNLAGGVFDCQVNQTLFSNQAGALARFDNAGIFRKSAGTGDTTCNWVFNNTGTVQAQSGSIRLANGGTSTGTFNASTGTLDFVGGTHTLNAGAACTGAGFCRLTFGTLALGANLGVTNFEVAGGTLNGAGNLTVGTVLNWSAGTMGGTGTTTIGAGKALNITGGSHILLRPLSNAGTVVWTAGPIDSGQGTTLTNLAGGVFDCQVNQGLFSNQGGALARFDNAGTFRKSAGTGDTTCNWVFNNTGSLQAQSGTIRLANGGTSTGTFNASTGTLEFVNGTHILNAGAACTGAGFCRLTFGTLTLGANVSVTNFDMTGGTLNGTGNLTVGTVLNWSAGTMGGTGTTTIPAGKALNITGGSHILLRPLSNAGTVAWTAGPIDSGQGTTLTNLAGGVFDCQVNQGLFSNQGGALARFDNAGTFRKSAGTGDTTCNWVFNNTGSLQAQSGTIRLANGGTSTGTFNASTGTLEFVNGTHILNAGAACTGAGFCRLTFGTLTLGANVSVTNFAITGGTLNGTGNLTVGTVLNWSGGTMSGTGTTTIPAGKAANLTGSTHILLRPLSNAGTVVWTAGPIDSGQGTTLTNLAGGVFDCQVDQGLFSNQGGALAQFSNAGIFRKSVGNGNTACNWAFNNAGTVQAQSGTLLLQAGGASTGVFNASTGELKFNGGTHTLNAGASCTGAGFCRLTFGTVTLAGNVSVSNFELASGTLNGAGNLTVGNVLNWSGGTMSGTGTTTIPAGKTLNITSGFHALLRPLVNAGNTVWTGGAIDSGQGLALTNQAGGVFDCQVDQSLFANQGGALPQFSNAGTFRKSAAAGTTTCNWPFTNTGTVQAQSGTIRFQSTFTQTAGSTLLNGGSLATSTTLNIQGGTLGGAGTVTGNVSNAGVVSPGASPGILTLSGNYVQSAAGALKIEIGGLAAGTQYDRLAITGSATLNGTLQVQTINGFSPAAGNTFQILTYGSRTGTFAAMGGLSLGNGLAFRPAVGATDLVLTAVLAKPDLLIKRTSEADSAFAINNTYQATPSGAQVEAQAVAPGVAASYAVKVENDGSSAIPYVVKAVETAQAGWTITYAVGGSDITAAITGAGYTTPNLAPGASVVITVLMTPGATVPGGTTKSTTLSVLLNASDTAVRDSVRATTSVNTVRQADLLIKRSTEAAGAFAIDNVYQATPAGDQIEPVSVNSGAVTTYNMQVQNDGNVAQTFVLKALEGAGAGWTITYTVGATNITTAIKSSTGFTTASLAPGANLVVTVTMTAGPTAVAGTAKTVTVNAFHAASDTTVRDSVRAETTVNLVRKADLLIKKGTDPASAYAANNVYQTTPGGLQLETQNTDRGIQVAYNVQLQNDGNIAQTFVLKATESAGAGWNITYLVGGVNVGTAITGASGFTTASLAPGASTVLTVFVRPGGTVFGGSTKSVTVRAFLDGADTTTRDAVVARTGVNIVEKADLLIKKGSEAASAFAIDNTYQTTPAGNQIEAQTALPGATATYNVLIQSDGSVSITPVVKATVSAGAGWVVTYKDGITDVTAQITSASGYTTRRLVPGASLTLTVAMTPNVGTIGSKSATLRVFHSATDATVRDAVQATTTAGAPGAPPAPTRALSGDGILLRAACAGAESEALLTAAGLETANADGLQFEALPGGSIARPAGGNVWEFAVAAPGADTTVVLTWPGVAAAGDNALALVDLDTNARRSLRSTSSYVFQGARRRFAVVSEPVAGRALMVTGVEIAALRGTARAVRLTLSAPANVDVVIVTPAGRTLSEVTRARALPSGTSEVYWNGAVAPGIYLVRVTATGDDGTQVQSVRPAVVTR